MDLIDLREEYDASGDFKHLRAPFNYYVPGRGSERPTVMLLGEAPGATENNARRPFVGASGRVLGGLMELAGLSAEIGFAANTYITNTVKYRPPGNRTPTREEIHASLPWIRREWKILHRPPVIVTVGAVPLACVGARWGNLAQYIARPFKTRNGNITIWPMYHPAYALRNPPIRPRCEEHWQALGAWLKEEGLA